MGSRAVESRTKRDAAARDRKPRPGARARATLSLAPNRPNFAHYLSDAMPRRSRISRIRGSMVARIDSRARARARVFVTPKCRRALSFLFRTRARYVIRQNRHRQFRGRFFRLSFPRKSLQKLTPSDIFSSQRRSARARARRIERINTSAHGGKYINRESNLRTP